MFVCTAPTTVLSRGCGGNARTSVLLDCRGRREKRWSGSQAHSLHVCGVCDLPSCSILVIDTHSYVSRSSADRPPNSLDELALLSHHPRPTLAAAVVVPVVSLVRLLPLLVRRELSLLLLVAPARVGLLPVVALAAPPLAGSLPVRLAAVVPVAVASALLVLIPLPLLPLPLVVPALPLLVAPVAT